MTPLRVRSPLPGTGLFQLVGACLVITVLKRSRLDDGERAQWRDFAVGHHALVLSRAGNFLPHVFSVIPDKITQTLVSVAVDHLADGVRYALAAERRVHTHAAERILVEQAARQVAQIGACHFVAECEIGLREADRTGDARAARGGVVAALLRQGLGNGGTGDGKRRMKTLRRTVRRRCSTRCTKTVTHSHHRARSIAVEVLDVVRRGVRRHAEPGRVRRHVDLQRSASPHVGLIRERDFRLSGNRKFKRGHAVVLDRLISAFIVSHDPKAGGSES